jgi:hypothetical protein
MKRSMGILDQFDLPNDFLDEWREYEKDADKNFAPNVCKSVLPL